MSHPSAILPNPTFSSKVPITPVGRLHQYTIKNLEEGKEGNGENVTYDCGVGLEVGNQK